MNRFLQWVGATFVALVRWSLEAIGEATVQLVQALLRQMRRTTFGNFRRGVVTCAIASLLLANYFPRQCGPLVVALWNLGFALLGVYVLLYPIRLFVNGGTQQRRRRRN
jgi:hypothetical protein